MMKAYTLSSLLLLSLLSHLSYANDFEFIPQKANEDFAVSQDKTSPRALNVDVTRVAIPISIDDVSEFMRRCDAELESTDAKIRAATALAYVATTYSAAVGNDSKLRKADCAYYYISVDKIRNSRMKDFYEYLSQSVFVNPWNTDESLNFNPTLFVNSNYSKLYSDSERPELEYIATLRFEPGNGYSYDKRQVWGSIYPGDSYGTSDIPALNQSHSDKLPRGFIQNWSGLESTGKPELIEGKTIVSVTGIFAQKNKDTQEEVIGDIRLSLYEDEQVLDGGHSKFWLEYKPTHYKVKSWNGYGKLTWYPYNPAKAVAYPLVERRKLLPGETVYIDVLP